MPIVMRGYESHRFMLPIRCLEPCYMSLTRLEEYRSKTGSKTIEIWLKADESVYLIAVVSS
jgi:hypothetical protein